MNNYEAARESNTIVDILKLAPLSVTRVGRTSYVKTGLELISILMYTKAAA